MVISLRHEGLEAVLFNLQDGLDPHTNICIKCWALWDDGTCQCTNPIWWPASHAVRRLQTFLSTSELGP